MSRVSRRGTRECEYLTIMKEKWSESRLLAHEGWLCDKKREEARGNAPRTPKQEVFLPSRWSAAEMKISHLNFFAVAQPAELAMEGRRQGEPTPCVNFTPPLLQQRHPVTRFKVVSDFPVVGKCEGENGGSAGFAAIFRDNGVIVAGDDRRRSSGLIVRVAVANDLCLTGRAIFLNSHLASFKGMVNLSYKMSVFFCKIRRVNRSRVDFSLIYWIHSLVWFTASLRDLSGVLTYRFC